MTNVQALASPIPATELIPHRGAMRLIDALTAHAEGEAEVRATIRADGAFVDAAGRLDAVAFIEMMAQTTAALAGFESRLGGAAPRSGLLIAINEVDLRESAAAGDTLTIAVRRTLAFDSARFFAGEVKRGSEVLAGGTIRIWETQLRPDDDNASTEVVAITPSRDQIVSPVHCGVSAAMREFGQADGKKAHASFAFPPGFIGFDGHFPQSPILPGVATLMTGLVVAEQSLGEALRILEVPVAKFPRPVLPDLEVHTEIEIRERQGDEVRLSVSVRDRHEPVSNFLLLVGRR